MPPERADYAVRLVDADGAPDMSVAVVGDQVVDLSQATAGQVLVMGDDGLLRFGTPPGLALERSVGGDQVTIGTSEIDLGVSVEIPIPEDRDVQVWTSVPRCGAVTASGIVTVKLTDENNAMSDPKNLAQARSGTASRNEPPLFIDEIIPAGSGTVIRKLRGICTTADGYANLLGLGKIVLDSVVR